MEAATITALGTAAAGAAQMMDSVKGNKLKKKKMIAELLDKAQDRSLLAQKDARATQNSLAAERNKAIQDMATGFRLSLTGRMPRGR